MPTSTSGSDSIPKIRSVATLYRYVRYTMGASSSRPPSPPPPPPLPTEACLSRSMTNTAHEVVAEQLRNELRTARLDASRYKRYAREALEDVDAAVAEMEGQRARLTTYGLIASLAASAGGGVLGFLLARRQSSLALARLSNDIGELRRRGAAEVAKAERFGSQELAKSLIPSLDAMDGLCNAGGGDEEGSRLTRSLLLDALSSHGIRRIEPAAGDRFDVASMEVGIPLVHASFARFQVCCSVSCRASSLVIASKHASASLICSLTR